MNKPDATSEIINHPHGGVTITGPDAMLYYKSILLKSHIDLYMKTGMIPTRGVGIKRMLELTAEITKPVKPYKTSKQGQAVALADITNWCSVMKSALPIN